MNQFNSLPSQISKANKLIHHSLTQELKNHGIHGLSPSHGSIIVNLYRQGTMSMSDLTKAINRKKNTTTVLIKKLVHCGYVNQQIDNLDSRKVLISLTTEGYEFQKQFEDISNRMIEKVFLGFEDEEKQIFFNMILKVINNFE